MPGTWGDTNKTLDLGAISPALEGTYNVLRSPASAGDDGLRTVKAKLAGATRRPPWRPASPGVKRRTYRHESLRSSRPPSPGASLMAQAPTTNTTTIRSNRAQILLVALTGNVGKPGGGFESLRGAEKIWPEDGFISWPIR